MGYFYSKSPIILKFNIPLFLKKHRNRMITQGVLEEYILIYPYKYVSKVNSKINQLKKYVSKINFTDDQSMPCN